MHHHFGTVFGIARTLSGTYITPGWHPVPEDTTRDQIEFDESLPLWYPPDMDPNKVAKKMEEAKIEQPVTNKSNWKIEASKPGTFYNVTFNGTYWKCTCPANSFRRGDCKHITKVKSKL